MDDKLNAILSRTTPKPDDDAEDLGKCASGPRAKYVPAFHVKNGAAPVRTFDFQHVGFKQFEPTRFVMEFHEPEHWRMTVEGRNLWPIYNYLCQHRLEWIEADHRGIAPDREPIITSIVIETVDEESEA